MSGNFSFSGGNETLTQTTTSGNTAEIGVTAPVNSVPVTANAGASQTATATSGIVRNGEKQEFQVQLVYDAKSNSFTEIKVPISADLKQAAKKLENASSFPKDIFGSND